MGRILVTGACGQIGSELVLYLADQFGESAIIASDIKNPSSFIKNNIPFFYLDVLDFAAVNRIVVEQNVGTIFHMAAILSAVGEKNPQLAYQINMQGLMNVLEAARQHHMEKIIIPSSIAAFGPDAPKDKTPDNTIMNPTTMYGVTKVAGEKLAQYYHFKYGVDARSLRYPGIISSETLPGGGTTDFAVDLYLNAIDEKKYTCYIAEETVLPFMYMPDAIKAIVDLAAAPGEKLTQQVYNVHALSLAPRDIVASIRNEYPSFRISYDPDFRQSIAESWPRSLNDSAARRDWNWSPRYDLHAMTRDMLKKLKK
ncbi:MAG: NAD-dependent epimerase/dehydratase family protein [Calditrichia bacterium]